jgi:threonine dehydratase/serine racemase
MSAYAADLAAVRAAASRIAAAAHQTPVATCATLDRHAGCQVFLKCENVQKAGAFKFRGAYNAVACLPRAHAARGVVTHSSGNHAQALALAACLHGIAAHIVMPRNAAGVKRRAVEEYGARVVECEPTLSARESTAARVLADTGASFVHPYDHPDVIAGQGTVALEFLDAVPDLDVLVAPIGGGGLISGLCVAARELRPRLRIVGAEPAGADDAWRSLRAGVLVPQENPRTIADGLLTSLGELTWPIVRDHVERVVRVDDEHIVAAMRFVWERAKLLIEPSAAVAVAAVLSDEFPALANAKRIGVVLSGGNADLDHLPW